MISAQRSRHKKDKAKKAKLAMAKGKKRSNGSEAAGKEVASGPSKETKDLKPPRKRVSFA